LSKCQKGFRCSCMIYLSFVTDSNINKNCYLFQWAPSIHLYHMQASWKVTILLQLKPFLLKSEAFATIFFNTTINIQISSFPLYLALHVLYWYSIVYAINNYNINYKCYNQHHLQEIKRGKVTMELFNSGSVCVNTGRVYREDTGDVKYSISSCCKPTPRSTVLKKLIVGQLLKKFLTFHGI
jgi:hypothetical protein